VKAHQHVFLLLVLRPKRHYVLNIHYFAFALEKVLRLLTKNYNINYNSYEKIKVEMLLPLIPEW
jgi:hypothetical protein